MLVMTTPDSNEILIKTVSAKWVACRRVTCAHDKIGESITAPTVYPGIYDLARRHDVQAGPPYARYLQWRENDCDIQCGVPLSGPIPPEGDIAVDFYTACRVVSYTFIGPYSGLGQAHEKVIAYIKENELKHGGPCWEIYDGPGDPDGNATTHICYPIES